MNNQKLAKKIASKILKMYGPRSKEAHRVALMFGKYPDKEYTAGGKNKPYLVEEIEAVLQKYNIIK